MVEIKWFLRKKLHYYLSIAVIATTLFSWFNLNSYLIILLVICRLLDGGPRAALRAAIRNVFFWAYSALFLVELAGLLYTHDLFWGWKDMESKATLLAIPVVICGGPFTDNNGYRRLMTAYCAILTGICLYCLGAATRNYLWQGDIRVFFYHDLSAPVGVNAVFFSGYVLIAVLFLLFADAPRFAGPGPRQRGRALARVTLLLFFSTMMVLLSSRLMLLLTVAAVAIYLFQRARRRRKLMPVVAVCALGFVSLGMLATTDNPFSRRYRELRPEQISAGIRPQPMDRSTINGVSLRLFMWRSAVRILNEGHSWLLGVSGGDSQIRLNEKYMAAGMSEGYLDYNFHNEYIEILVHSGIAGEVVFLFFIGALVGMTLRTGTAEAWFTVAIVILLCMTESALEMQHGLFLASFFPLLQMCARKCGAKHRNFIGW